ncbi:MAG: CDP-alcohol phosphatidyltransferase family protein [Anaerolineae bacterium]|nr:CDP-alcohol phosphatidyltransferase family protein [Anaerolineae bacterium]MCB9131893.1 CDP-alcohol phosphatidyltransferase family protein [Anaerolineales bacterium]MCB0233208.1 CDP-alcohol phosphatidyltransferase family protein [Anaerolineae bacterium]MCB0237926.1 CDP-alcohol phosphatidyltransferase family protein [Anaerolineae bacterium]MCB0242096.1 CDP-alcohol phosphatidyltransferase family protein [Anaerolineae bacterium]
MLTAWLRKTFRGVLEAVARFFNRLGVSPNQLTLIGLILQGIVAAVIAAGYLQLAGILLIFFSIFDAFDGTLARMTGQVSRFGAFFDATIDRYAESIVLFGLLVYYSGQPDSTTQTLLIYVAIVGSLLVSYTRAKAESLGIPCKEGILTRAERVVLLVIGLLLGTWQPIAALPDALTVVLWLLAILSNVTAIQRVLAVRKTVREQDALPDQPA